RYCGETSPARTGRLVLGTQSLENAAAKFPPREIQARCFCARGYSAKTVQDIDSEQQLAGRRRHERTGDQSDKKWTARCAREYCGSGKTGGALENRAR